MKAASFGTVLLAATLVGALPDLAPAEVTFEMIGTCLATDVSADGSVVVGNTFGEYETFRWTTVDGIVPLGRATVPVLGVGAGTPDVSSDGTRISATILSDDGTHTMQGLWTLGSGWQVCGPMPADAAILDQSLASAWGLSGDGQTLVGLYWRAGQPGGSAHPSSWTQATGVVDLGTLGSGTCENCGSGRANAASADGSVIVGWIENPNFGNWWPTVWVNGVRTILRETEGFAEASCVTPDGLTIGGHSWFPPINQFSLAEAAAWRWDGSQWVVQRIGKLPGTVQPFGIADVTGISADGSLMVGYNRFNQAGDTGFVWTQSTGMVDVVNYLTSNNVTLPANFDFSTLSAVSEDGSVLVGIGYETVEPFEPKSFRITRCILRGDINKDTIIDALDIAGFVRAKLGQTPQAAENPTCADYGGTLEEDIAAFTADLLGS